MCVECFFSVLESYFNKKAPALSSRGFCVSSYETYSVG
ncbi:hypothetical protein PG5_35200 [Pseudomonas sp. G5(2012)]|nr:hypothetical protein PG5_35200 [Pseudomonas sp. G5(2012)]